VIPHDPEARAAARLAEDAQAWLPTDDPDARRHILALLEQVLSTGVDPLAALRAALTHWFGPAARIALPPPRQSANRHDPPTPLEGIAIETLPLLRKPTLWPQRPKRRPDELFSSWLRRAAIAAGVSPHRFARDALGTRYTDTDRDIPEATLRRLALVSGQRFEHLANGTLAAMPHRPQTSRDGLVQDTVLHDGRLLLSTAPPGTRAGRPRAVLQYCPTCLAEDTLPCFRRGWRFAFEVVCIPHQCRLYDACWVVPVNVVEIAV
jgi:hypothetical protein